MQKTTQIRNFDYFLNNFFIILRPKGRPMEEEGVVTLRRQKCEKNFAVLRKMSNFADMKKLQV